MSERAQIEELLGAYRAAVRAKDVDAFVAIYDENVRIFDTWQWSYDGVESWRAMATEWFGSLGDEQVEVEHSDVQIVAGDGVAVVHAFTRFKGISASGEELRAMENRLTWGLRKTDAGAWKVVHEHTSAPADFGTGKVTLAR
jgi:ketosteroid isomerase-like protein